MRAVDDRRPLALVELCLRSELAAEELDEVLGRPLKRLGDVDGVDDVGLDAVAAALDLLVSGWVGVVGVEEGGVSEGGRKGRESKDASFLSRSFLLCSTS